MAGRYGSVCMVLGAAGRACAGRRIVQPQATCAGNVRLARAVLAGETFEERTMRAMWGRPRSGRVGVVLLASGLAACGLAACGGGGGDGGGSPPPTAPPPATGTTGGTPAAPSGGAASTPVEGTTVTVRNNSFGPGNLAVQIGGTVTWTWDSCGDDGYGGQSCVSHDVTFAQGGGSRVQGSGSYSRTFAAAGTYPYQCSIHGSAMSGQVVVR
jgi:plastocyanin